MSYVNRIKLIKITNCLGISEFEVEAGKLNIISGDNGKGKTSILDVIAKGLNNRENREDFIKHGEDKATIYIKLADGTTVKRTQTAKSSSVTVSKDGMIAPKSETYLKNLISGLSFNPVDFMQKSEAEQAKILLSMIDLDIEDEQWAEWFGTAAMDLDIDQHPLKVLKQAEKMFYDSRTSYNTKVKTLTSQLETTKSKLPANYNPEDWKDVSLKDKWEAVSNASKLKQQIAKSMQTVSNKGTEYLNIDNKCDLNLARISKEEEAAIEKIKADAAKRVDAHRSVLLKHRESISEKETAIEEYQRGIERLKDEIGCLKFAIRETECTMAEIHNQDNTKLVENAHNEYAQKIAAVEQTRKELKEVVDQTIQAAETFIKEHPTPDEEELRQEAIQAEQMKELIPTHEQRQNLSVQIAALEKDSHACTTYVELARSLPTKLQNEVIMPIDGLTIDDQDRICINELPLKNMSTAEQLLICIKIAKALAGPLKVVCIDRYESLSPNNQAILENEIAQDDFQYFITKVADGDMQVNVSE